MSELNSPTSVIYTLDNLKVLRGLNSECIDLIYLNPPFNTGKQWQAPIGERGELVGFNDIWGWDRVTGETLEQTIARQWEEERDYAGTAVREVVEAAIAAHSPQMGAYCAFMAPRLIEMHRVLKPTGSIYLHCDPFASHYLKPLMDSVFGAANYLNEISWRRARAKSDAAQGAKSWPRVRDVLLHYRVSRPGPDFEQPFAPLDDAYVKRSYHHVEEETGRRYQPTSLTAPGRGTRGHPQYEFMGVTRYWRYSEERMNELAEQGRIIQTAPGRVPRYKRYLDESSGVPIGDDWGDIPPVQGRAKERTGYLTQKPIALVERIIKASTDPDDVILDPFAGCATACVAAQKHERHWVGIDIEPLAVELCRQRLRDELQLFDETQELTEAPKRTDAHQLDLLPRGQALRLELWRRLQAEQQKPESQNAACPGCGRSPDLDYFEVDHIVPRGQGGEHTRDNLQLLCGPCNRSKGNRTMTQWRRAQAIKSL